LIFTIYSGFFDYIENVIENENHLTMNDMTINVDDFLSFNKFAVLKGKGKIAKKEADEKALNEYAEFNKNQLIESDFDREIKKYLKKNRPTA